mgnify:CR=1 FL=1
MNLIERYVSEIGKQLPRKSRADIETEIRSTLEDMLEERSAKAGRPADDEMVKELLKEYGAPDKVAESYLPTRYLIGPELYPIFALIVKIVFTVLGVIWLILFGVRIATSDLTMQSFGALLGTHFLQWSGGLISAFGNIVLVFAILQWVNAGKNFKDETKEEEWSPEELTKEPDPDEIRPWEPIVTIVFTTLGLLVFNFYPQVLGMTIFAGEATLFIPALSDAFFRMLPWVNVVWILNIGLYAFLLRQGNWTPAARWFEIALKVAGIAIAYILLQGPPILTLDAARLVAAGMEQSAAGVLVSMLQQIVTIALAIAVVVGGLEVVKGVYNLLVKKASRPLPVK